MPSPLSQVPRPGLLRQVGFFSATALVISNMVGTGIFATTGFMAGDLGSAPLILACWMAGALFAIAGALSYSELGINFPSSGGEYVYLTIYRSDDGGFARPEDIYGYYNFWNGSSWEKKARNSPITEAKSGTANFIAPFIMDPRRVQDIDTLEDWELAELKFKLARP